MAAPARYHRGPMPSMSSIFTQMWPPKPGFTERDIPDLQGKVYIVTGGSSGVGREVVRILYGRNAKVYIGARSEERASQAIKYAQDSSPDSRGALKLLHMDFADLKTVQSAVKSFETREKQLHALFNNAGVQSADKDAAQTVQGWELHFGVNCLAPFLLTHLLTPVMLRTVEAGQDVRVVWVCSLSVEMLGEKSRGISSDYLEYYSKLTALERYGVSKAGSWLHGVEMARRFPQIISIPCNPGHLKSDLYREQNKCLQGALNMAVLYPPIYGALTELVAGTSTTVRGEDSGRWMIPWGRWGQIRPDLIDATRPQSEGGNGHARQFWDWCFEQVAPYAG